MFGKMVDISLGDMTCRGVVTAGLIVGSAGGRDADGVGIMERMWI